MRVRLFMSGWGWIAGALFFGAPVAMQLIVNEVRGAGTYSRHTHAFYIAAMLGAAVIVWILGRWLNERDSPGARSNFDAAHTFIFLRLEYWAGIYMVMALLSLLV